MPETKAYEKGIEKQFDHYCKLVVKNTCQNLRKHSTYRKTHEKHFSECSQKELNHLSMFDHYHGLNKQVMGFEVENELLYDALMSLSTKRRKVIVLKYFAEMTETEIGDLLNMTRTGVQYLKDTSLATLRNYMSQKSEGNVYAN